MEMEMEVEIEMEVEMEMAMEMHMQMEMEIFKAPEASCELTLASKMLFASDFEALEVYGCTTSRSREHHKAPGEASRGSYEAPWRCFGSSWDPESSPSHDPRYIHRFQSLQDPSRRSPSHDLSTLSTF